MTKKNILRLNRQTVLDKFIVSFYANELNSNFYSKANLPQKWLKELNISDIERISFSDYEETLSNFFNKGNAEFTSHPLLLILGGVGTGKSSSIRHSLSSSNICEECLYTTSCSNNFPARIIVDFINFRTAVETETPEIIKPSSIKETTEKFWYHILTILDEVINDEMDTQMEISVFWKWLFEQKSVAVPISLYKILYPKRRLFGNYNDNGDELLILKDALFEKLNTKELSKYKLFQIAYLRQNKTANCNFILFDNIDTLAPYLQAELVNFALEAHRLLKSRAVIPVRPHTLATNKDASDFFEVLEHWKPSLEDVFKLRLREFKPKTDIETYTAVESLVNLIKNSKIFKSVFIGTSGKSVRYALRNFYNFSLSPLIVTHIDNKPVVEIELTLNTFFQAYFCSETKNEMLDEDNFHNMLSIRKSTHHSYFSNLKLRFLHLMYTNNTITLGKLFKTLFSFGYEKYEILIVLNEFLDPKKSLIWSSTLTQYSKKEMKKGDTHILRINHLGVNYFEKVINEPFYLRECIIAVTRKRHKGKEANLSIVIDTLKHLEDLDYEEINDFIDDRNVKKYNEIYNKDECSISYIMWKKIKNGLQYWKTINSEFIFDYDRDRHIKGRVDKIKAENNV